MAQLIESELSDEQVQTRFGAHIVRMEMRESGRQLPFESVANKSVSNWLNWREAVRGCIKLLSDLAIIASWQQLSIHT